MTDHATINARELVQDVRDIFGRQTADAVEVLIAQRHAVVEQDSIKAGDTVPVHLNGASTLGMVMAQGSVDGPLVVVIMEPPGEPIAPGLDDHVWV